MATNERRQPNLAVALTEWWRNWRHRRAAVAELANCGPEMASIAHDVGLAPADLCVLAAKRPDAADLLSQRLAALQLDTGDLSVSAGPVVRDLQRLCTVCESKGRCVRDLDEHPLSEDWRDYCPNAGTLESLVADADEQRALARLERRQARRAGAP